MAYIRQNQSNDLLTTEVVVQYDNGDEAGVSIKGTLDDRGLRSALYILYKHMAEKDIDELPTTTKS